MRTLLFFSTVELKISIIDAMEFTFDHDFIAVSIDEFEEQPLPRLRDEKCKS
jgi:hypothetical protein